MIKLHGIGVSNYHNAAKLAFLEKGVPFEEVSVMPGNDPAVLAASPMGKVPYLIRPDGSTLSEVNVIFDYLEDIQPEPALYPRDPWDRAKTKEIIRNAELYLDAAARPLLPMVYFGVPRNDAVADAQKPLIEKGLRAFKQLAVFDPYVAGPNYTFADIASYFHLQFTNLHTTRIYDWDIIASDPELGAYMDVLAKRPKLLQVGSEMQQALDGFLKK
jgi:glutathione S-transferase